LRSESFEIAASAEHLAGATQHHGSNIGIVGASPGRVTKLGCEFEIDSIGGVGTVESDVRDVIAKIENQF
jgi:hypothetical protein